MTLQIFSRAFVLSRKKNIKVLSLLKKDYIFKYNKYIHEITKEKKIIKRTNFEIIRLIKISLITAMNKGFLKNNLN